MNSRKNHDPACTTKDEKNLGEHFGKVSTEVLSDRFGRTVHAIRQRARELGIRVRPYYLPAQDAFLLRNHTRMSTAALAVKMRRTKQSVRRRLKALGMQTQTHRPFTEKELAYLRQHHEEAGTAIARALGRDPDSTRHKLRTLGFRKRNAPRAWTEEEDRYLRTWYGKKKAAEISRILNRQLSTIHLRLKTLGIPWRHKPRWAKKDDEFLRKNYQSMTGEKLAKKLHRTNDGIHSRRMTLRLLYSPRSKPYSEEELLILRTECQRLTIAELARKLNRNISGIRTKLMRMGLKEGFLHP